MALHDRYWVGNGMNTEWNLASNWAASSGGVGGASVPLSSNDVTFDGNGLGNCFLDDFVFALSFAVTSGYSGNFDTFVFDVTVSGDITLAGTGTWDMGDLTTWICSGDFDHSDVSTNGIFVRGTATLIMTGTNKTIKWGLDLYSLTIQAAATIAVHADSAATCDVAGSLTVNGELSIPSGKTLRRPTAGQPDTVIGASGSLTGAGAYLGWQTGFDNSAGGTCNVASLTCQITGSGDQTETFAGTITSAEVILSTTAGVGDTHTWRMQNATFGGNVTYQANGLGTLAIDNATNNPNITYQGDVTRTPGTGAITWTKGTGTITLSGSSTQSVDLDFGSAVEDLVVNATGTVTLAGDVETDSFTGTAGTFDPNGYTVTTTDVCTWSSGFDFVADADAMNGCSWLIGGNFSADGQTMNATASWVLTVLGAIATATGVSVEFSDASGGLEIDASASTDGGGNLNWSFGNRRRRMMFFGAGA